jgi:DNA repair exonuclease SbcCD ATPase subunit
MISEFQDLSDKINRLAELTHALRLENAELRNYNSVLIRDNLDYNRRLAEAQTRVQALLEKLPPETPAAGQEGGAQ